jgi:hypothetical protein
VAFLASIPLWSRALLGRRTPTRLVEVHRDEGVALVPPLVDLANDVEQIAREARGASCVDQNRRVPLHHGDPSLSTTLNVARSRVTFKRKSA